MKFAQWMFNQDVALGSGPLEGDLEVLEMTCDSREVKPGWAFVALKGEQVDGADFLPAALAQGAVAILSDRELSVPPGIAFGRLGDGRRTMALLARSLYGHGTPDGGPGADGAAGQDRGSGSDGAAGQDRGSSAHRPPALIAVTGTNGKTTTTTLIRQLLRGSGLGCGMVGTVINAAGDLEEPAERTTPESPAFYRWLQRSAAAGDRAVAVEVSSHSLMLARVFGARFQVGVFTNLTQDHLDFHGDMEAYFQAKALLFSQCASKLVNADDPYGRRLLEAGPGLLSFAIECEADYRATELALSPTGTRFQLSSPRGAWAVASPLLGRFNAYNLLAALAALAEAGFDLERILPALASLTGAPGRLDRVDCGQPFGVMVDYAHTPDALEKLLIEGKRLLPAGGRLHVLFGCGGDRDRGKRPLMAQVVAAGADVLWHTSDNTRMENPEQILLDAAAGIPAELLADPSRYHRILDRAAAVAQAIADCRPGDLLLLAGKGHEPYQDVQGVKRPYSDRAAVTAALQGGAR